MKILFLCGSLESSKDGVGDYTKKLAITLQNMGHQLSIIALMDKFIDGIQLDSIYIFNNQSISTLRLPFIDGIEQNCINAKSHINEFDPDWISLQYVPFSFNNRGLPFNLAYHINQITNGRKFQIMFHEMWMGISVISPLKHKIIGFFQRKIVQRLVIRCQPQNITTTNKLYQSVLSKGHINTKILPLFSNIEISLFDLSYYRKILASFSININERSDWNFIGIFGSLHDQINLEKELSLQIIESNQTGKKLLFISIGRIGKKGEIEFERLKNVFKDKIKFFLIGQVEERDASLLLQMLDLVISCTPAHHIGKSGVYAFFKSHAIPVLLIHTEILPDFKIMINEWLPFFTNRVAEKWTVEYIAKKFINNLNNSNSFN